MVLAKCLRFRGYDWWESQWPLCWEQAQWPRQQAGSLPLSLPQLCVCSYLPCHHLDIPKISQTQPVQDRIDHDFM